MISQPPVFRQNSTPPSGIIDIMKSARTTAKANPRGAAKAPSQKAIMRAVASSTAIETGKSIRQIERMLRVGKSGKFLNIKLAR